VRSCGRARCLVESRRMIEGAKGLLLARDPCCRLHARQSAAERGGRCAGIPREEPHPRCARSGHRAAICPIIPAHRNPHRPPHHRAGWRFRRRILRRPGIEWAAGRGRRTFRRRCMFQLQRFGLLQRVDYISSGERGSLAAAFYCVSDTEWNPAEVQGAPHARLRHRHDHRDDPAWIRSR
jgi:hypothetical protein